MTTATPTSLADGSSVTHGTATTTIADGVVEKVADSAARGDSCAHDRGNAAARALRAAVTAQDRGQGISVEVGEGQVAASLTVVTAPLTAGRALDPRLVRLTTHSSRTGSAIALAVLLILLFVWLGTEAVLAVLGRPALFVAPQDGASSLLTAAAVPIALTAAAGAVLALVGLVLIVVSLASNRREGSPPRWRRSSARSGPGSRRPSPGSTGRGTRSRAFAGIWGGTTLPEYRGRGLYGLVRVSTTPRSRRRRTHNEG
ncbi:Asp23/Gls24 family envelope stress response protein [Rathayibacter tritici]|nr:Asp23/Gls24 family envelope stress response protein [Rathayibacter tritici]